MAYFYGLTSTAPAGLDLLIIVIATIVLAIAVAIVISLIERPATTVPSATTRVEGTYPKAA